MPIDKLIPRKLNSDIDAKLVDKASMLDALNLYSGDDESGGGGVLKNVKGNTKVSQSEFDLFGNGSRVLGSVIDQKTNIAYFFVFSSEAQKQGVWAYDPDGKLANDGAEAVRLIYKSKQFNFSSNGFVKGDVVHINTQTLQDGRGDEFDTDAVIFFTDNKNEPRKINAYRAYSSGTREEIHGDNIYAEADFITACPKTPLDPITFVFDRDVNRKTSNFKGTAGYQFAYQHVYKDGFESSISVYSDVAFPPSVVNQGANMNASHDSYNRCLLYIPKAGPEIDSIKILVREGLGGSFLFIDEVKRDSLFVGENYIGVYNFHNDRVAKGVSKNEVNKQFDSVPRKAKAQSVAGNRLMYGNYLDGFDNVDTDCTAQVVYRERPSDFVELEVKVNTFIGVHEGQPLSSNSAQRKSAGFTIDTSSFPDSMTSGANILVKVTMTPDRNWHIYNSDNSYHQSALIGEYEQLSGTQALVENNNANVFQQQGDLESGLSYLKGQGSELGKAMLFAGDNVGVDSTDVGLGLYWKTKYLPTDGTAEGPSPVRLGTSAANPIILRGGGVLFQAGFALSNQVNSGFASIAATTLEELFLGLEYSELTHSSVISEGSIIQVTSSVLNHSLNISNHDAIGQNYLGQNSEQSTLSKMIMAVTSRDASGNHDNELAPMGYVIFKEAKATFSLKSPDDAFTNVSGSTKKVFRLALTALTDVKPMTCFKSMLPITSGPANPLNISDYPFLNTWGVIDPEVEFFADGVESDFDFEEYFDYFGTEVEDLALDYSFNENQETLSVDFGEEYLVNGGGNDMHRHMLGYLSDSNSNTTFDLSVDPDIPCVFDGEGGPGGGPSRGGGVGGLGGNIYDVLRLNHQGSIPYATPIAFDETNLNEYTFNAYNGNLLWSSTFTLTMSPMVTGRISLTRFSHPLPTPFNFQGASGAFDNDKNASALPLLQVGRVKLVDLDAGNSIETIKFPTPFENLDGNPDINSVNFNILHSNVELEGFIIGSYSGDVFRSFKSNSNHDFGVVYYDERGRHGGVNHLANVFVPGLSQLDRGVNPGGPSSVSLALNHAPPSWAHYFKILYGGNSTIDRFIQYSVPNAYVRSYDTDSLDEGNIDNIYVSLNYLQGNPISYVSSFGAKSPEGGVSMYNFKEGDKLRVISSGENNQRAYHQSSKFEFDVVGLVDIAEPLPDQSYSITLHDPDGEATNPRLFGEFLVLRDNQDAAGFNYQSTASGSSEWSKNCIVEIYSPSKALDNDEKFYYETGSTYRVSRIGDNILHSPSVVLLNKGDVWFRKGALNWKNEAFDDLIPDVATDEFELTSNFESVFIESSTATDLHESDFKGFGRANLITEGAKEVRREASISYSDKTNPESTRPRFTSFNNSLLNYSDYNYAKGAISYMSDSSGYLVVLQENSLFYVPISKNILSDASGSTNLIASNVVLGEAILQEGAQGCDSPESIVKNDDKIYYASKREGKISVFKIGAGSKDISTNVIGSSIRKSIKDLASSNGSTKIIGGYDSLKEEYLITIINLPNVSAVGVVEVDQPYPGDDAVVVGPSGGGDLEDTIGISGFQVFIDTDGDGVVGLNEFIAQSGVLNTDLPIAGPGQAVVNASLDGLITLAGQISIAADQAEAIGNAYIDISNEITVGGVTGLEPELAVASAILALGEVPTDPAELADFLNGIGVDPGPLLEAAEDNGGTTAFTEEFNPESNYDLIYKLLDNGVSGFSQEGSFSGNQDNQMTYGTQGALANILGLTQELYLASAPEFDQDTFDADLNQDGIVGTSDLLQVLASFGFSVPDQPADDEVIQSLDNNAQ